MLAFDAEKRLTAKEILEHKYFERVREKKNEYVINENELKFEFEFEDKALTQNDLRLLICHEIAFYNPKWKQIHFPNLEFE